MKKLMLFFLSFLFWVAFAGNGASSPVAINKATFKELQQLKGIGPKLADRILAYRGQHGKFLNVDDLKKVRGVHEKNYFEQSRENYVRLKKLFFRGQELV